MNRTIDLPKQSRGAEVRASSFSEADNSVELIWTTGAIVRRRGPSGPYDEELIVTTGAVNLARFDSGAAPFLDSHQDGSLASIIGAVLPGSSRIENGKGYARVKLSSAPSDADVVDKIKSGVIRNVSCGYSVDAVEIERRDNDVPLWRITRWTPIELSAVAVPADPGAQVRNAAVDTFRCEIISHRPATLRDPADDGYGQATAWFRVFDSTLETPIAATRARMIEKQRRAFAGIVLDAEFNK